MSRRIRTLIDRMRARRLAGKVVPVVRDAETGKPYPVTYPYGVKSSAYAAGHHTGEDHACPIGSPVYAVSWGEVVGINTWGEAYGYHVVIRTGDGRYDYAVCHLSMPPIGRELEVGTKVVPGKLIGTSGNTGNSTGPHVHLEARPAGGRYGTDVHPIRVKKGRRARSAR